MHEQPDPHELRRHLGRQIWLQPCVKVGNRIEVSGAVASDEHGHVVGKDDAYLQTKIIIQKIEKALLQAGASTKDVVPARMLVTGSSLLMNMSVLTARLSPPSNPADLC